MSKKEAILSAALKLLATNGVHATPMSAIAKEAATGMGTIYNYFSNKETLINALYVKIKDEERAVFPSFSGSVSIEAKFEEYYHNAIQFYIAHPLYFQFIEQLQASPIITKESKDYGYQAIATVLEVINQGKQDGIIKGLDTQEMMQFIGGTIISFLRLYYQTNKQKTPSLSNQMRMVWDAIKK